jgi:alkylation response protein AidB-like acyl-CoA dehydrogenase
MSTATANLTLKGGEFLIKETDAQDIFIPENWSEEQLMIGETCTNFVSSEVAPIMDRIDTLEEGLMPSLLDKAAELGLLGISVPEEYGGYGKDFTTSMLVTEKLGGGGSFGIALGAHTGIGMLPTLYYGNKAQKDKYIPKLASGEWKACYCLTEPSAGSDANSGKTKATLSADGKHYILNGQKMWITNGGFSEIFTVFAKIDDDKNLSAFIVEKSFGGVTLNAEEKKMGIKGSSTRQVFFENCKVPVENLLSERGNGFKIAVNILNLGRIKLAGGVLGGSKIVLSHAINYANERKQFNKSLSEFGAIQHKLAESAIRIYASEAATYRASMNMEEAEKAYAAGGMDATLAKLKGVEEFAVEAAILKVHASEVLDFVTDEGLQVYGGMGFSAEAPMERAYRDSRINRIFEGTNEINRMLIIDMMMKKAMKGELDLMTPSMAVAKEIMGIPDFDTSEPTLFSEQKESIKKFKKAILMVSGAAVQKFMQKLGEEQEILMNIADMYIETYVAESLQLRVEKLVSQRGEEACKEQLEMMRVYVHDAADKIAKAGRDAINSFAEGDERMGMLSGLKRFTKTSPLNTKAARRVVAEKLVKENKYCF